MKDLQSMIEELETKRMQEVLTLREQMLVAVFPCVISHIIWTYSDEVLRLCTADRISILKHLTRIVKELKNEYTGIVRKELDFNHIKQVSSQTEKFMNEYWHDFMILFFAVNNEFKKKMPDYPFDVMRTKALIVILFIRLLDEHNKEMDKLIRRKMMITRNSIRIPVMDRLYFCMDGISGEVDKFDFNDKDVKMAMNVIKNRLHEIDFEIGE